MFIPLQANRLGIWTLMAWTIGLVSASAAEPELLLARVNTHGPISSCPLPTFAHLQDASGQEYVLVKATADELDGSGWSYQVLDTDIESAAYILAYEFRTGARQAAHGQFNIVHDDGKRLIIRASTGDEVERLGNLGFQCRPFPASLIGFAAPTARALTLSHRMAAITSNAWVSEMVSQIKQTNLYAALADLSGIQPVVAGGSYTNIRTRHQNSGTPVRRATELAYEHFLALGLQPSYQTWNASGYSNRNVVGIQPGTSASSEIVVVCAHIDDMPSGSLAPGADDNASCSVGVLTAAEILRKFSFERTLRFVIFTGEEQGLYGSDAYASVAQSAGDNIVAVLNLDMIAWDGNADKVLNLYVRPGYASELDAAATFTNVVRVYGINAGLSPAIMEVAVDWSDHYSFNSYGYPAVCVIEEDNDDFNPYYHSTNDTLARINLPFFTYSVKAVVGTAAHLARPSQRLLFDSIQVQNGAFLASTNIGVGTFVARHESGTAEGFDSRDAAWSGMATNPNAAWLKIYTEPYSTNLAIDARPTNSETIFRGKLAAVKTNAGALTCTNRLKFEFACASDSNCAYMVKVSVDSNATPSHSAFECTTNLSQIIAGGGFLNLPGLSSVTNGTIYGTCEISRRFVSQASSNLVLDMPQVVSNGATLSLPCQLGTRVADSIEYTTNLLPAAPWIPLAAFTNDPVPDASCFETGWKSVEQGIDTSGTGDSPNYYFRIKRRWLAP